MAHLLLGRVGIAARQRVEQAPVHPEADLGAAGQNDHAPRYDQRLVDDEVEHVRQDAVAGELHHPGMEIFQRPEIGVEVRPRDRLFQRAAEALYERRPGAFGRALRRQAGDIGFQHPTHVVEIVHLPRIKAHDHRAAVRDPLDQAALLQRAERLADPRARDVELRCQVLLAKPASRRQRVARDALAQDAEDIDRPGRAAGASRPLAHPAAAHAFDPASGPDPYCSCIRLCLPATAPY